MSTASKATRSKGSNAQPGNDDFVGTVVLDLDKITEMASEEVSRISSSLATTASEILTCQSDQERRACVTKAMREYDTAVKWVQVIMAPDENKPETVHAPAKATAVTPAPPPSKAAPSWTALGNVPPLDTSLKVVPPPPSHPPSLPVGRLAPLGQPANQAFNLDGAGSWSNCSSTASLHSHNERPQAPAPQQAPRSNPNFHLEGNGGCSNRSSSTCFGDLKPDLQQAPVFDRQQPTAGPMLNLNPLQPPQMQPPQMQPPTVPQHPQQHLMNQLQQSLAAPQHPQQHLMNELQQSLAAFIQQPNANQCASGVQTPTNNMQGQQQMMPPMQNPQPMQGMQNLQQMPGMQSMPPMQGMPGMQNSQPMPGMQNMSPMSGMQNLPPMQMQGMQNAQPMQLPTVSQQMQGMQPPSNFQGQVICLPMGAAPPQGAIPVGPAPAGTPLSGGGSEQIHLMSEIFPQDYCQAPSSNAGKFRIVNPKTGEEVQAPSDSDKNNRRLRIVNPGTGKEVLPGDVWADKENTHFGDFEPSTGGPLQQSNSNIVQHDVDAKSGSWDWPLSRHETRERLDQLH